MLRHATLPLNRAWNTWSGRPAEMVFLPLGIRLTPVAFSAATGRATTFPPGDSVRFGRHELDGSRIELTLNHAETELRWHWTKTEPFAAIATWDAVRLGEWGLRFWVNLAVSAEGGETVRHDAASGIVTLAVGHRHLAVVCAVPPVLVTGHADLAALVADYEAHGYFDPRSRAEAAPLLALRFNLEMSPTNRIAAALADDRELAVAQAKAALDAVDLPPPDLQTGAHAGSLDAVRDVIGWNTLWDVSNARPYTAISRNWDLGKFGGWGVWLDDQLYAGFLAGLVDPQIARENLATAFAGATPQGNLPCLLTARDAWVDRTQIPVAAFLVRLMHLRSGDADLLEQAWPILHRNHQWWWANRDPQSLGLCSYGTSAVGSGMYGGTSFGARNESSMDNSPIHDEAAYDPATRTLTTLDVGLNSLLALDAEMLAEIADSLGLESEAHRYRLLAARTRRNVAEQLWDDARGIFANRLRGGGFVRSVGPTSFYPLVAGAVDAERLPRLLAHLDDPDGFAGRFGLPSVRRDDPAYRDNTYWRGRVWPPLNWLVWHGLRRVGAIQRATAMARKSVAMFERVWTERRLCPENYNAETGEPLDQPDTEGFYGWGALMPAMGVGEVVDITPWDGWTIVHDGEPFRLGPLVTPAGRCVIASDGGVLEIRRGSTALLRTTLRGRLTGIRIDAAGIALTLPSQPAAELVMPGRDAIDVALATLGGTPIAADAGSDGAMLSIPPSPEPRRLVVHLVG